MRQLEKIKQKIIRNMITVWIRQNIIETHIMYLQTQAQAPIN